MSWAIVRVRGTVNVKSKISKTLKFLRLHRPNHCIIVPENDSYKGMLNIVKDYVTWGEITPASVDMLAKDRILLEGGNVVSTAELKSLGFKNVNGVRIGKQIVIDLDANSKEEALKEVEDMSETLLANTVIEDYNIEIVE